MIRKLLSPPIYPDEELNRRAYLLNAVGWPTLLIAFGLGIGLLFAKARPLVLVTVFTMALIIATSLYWVRRGRVSQAALLFVFAGWVVTFLPAFVHEGLTSPYVFFAIVMTMLAALLLERRHVQVITTLSVLALIGLAVTQHYALIPQLIPPSPPIRRLLSITAAVLAISVILQTTMAHLRAALDQAIQNQRRLEESNLLLEEMRAVLERRVAERTVALEQRAAQLQSAAEVAAAIASIRDLDSLLQEITHLISSRFNYYHTGIYLVEENGRKAVLRAANTEAGQKLIHKGTSFALDEMNFLAEVFQSRQPRMIADVSTDEHYIPLEGLELTRSQILLPLLSGEKMLGCLDLHDTVVRAPSPDEITALRLLASQTATAIDNAQLFAAHQRAIDSLQRAYGQLSREGWQRLLQVRPYFGFRATSAASPQPVSGGWPEEMSRALEEGRVVQTDAHTLVVPVQVRDQIIGAIRLRKPANDPPWQRHEIALVQTLSDRLSTALESARLYQETRRRAERERLTAEITTRLRASTNLQEILQTAARELRRALGARQTQLIVQSTPISLSDLSHGDDGRPTPDDQALSSSAAEAKGKEAL